MRNIVEETYDRLINKWGSKEYKGIGTINCVPPVDYCEIISRIISLMRNKNCLLYTCPSPRDKRQSRMPSSA